MKLMILSFALLVSAFQAHLTFGRPLTTRSVDQLSLVTRYAGMGYNVLEANPEGDFNRGGIDPGIKTTRFVFKHTYNDGNRAHYRGALKKAHFSNHIAPQRKALAMFAD